MLLLETGNTTIKVAAVDAAGQLSVERYDALSEVDTVLARCREETGEIRIAPVNAGTGERIIEGVGKGGRVRVIGREDVAEFVAGSYDTPETLGLDRSLNLLGLTHDAIVISCGTAVTIDARAQGKPFFGAIMPGFTTAAQGLSKRIPVLPEIDVSAGEPHLPARTSYEAVANGILLGTAHGLERIAADLAAIAFDGSDYTIVLTGGDAEICRRLWQGSNVPEIDDQLLFRGMLAL